MKFYVEAYNSIRNKQKSIDHYQWLKDVIIKIGSEINWISINSPRTKSLIKIEGKEWSDKLVEKYLVKNLKDGINGYDKINDIIEWDDSESEEEKMREHTKKHEENMAILFKKEKAEHINYIGTRKIDHKDKKKMSEIIEAGNKNKQIMLNKSEKSEKEEKHKEKLSSFLLKDKEQNIEEKSEQSSDKNSEKNDKNETKSDHKELQLVPANLTNKRNLAKDPNKNKRYSYFCC
uniref:Kin17_mid domain-containing protein n=1 Tax=Meloidogyne hapla TaxID=6305 RepID=A0A1I8BNA9_MELHA